MLNEILLSNAQVAQRLGISAKMTRWYADRGLLPFTRLTPSGNRKYRRADVEALEHSLRGDDG